MARLKDKVAVVSGGAGGIGSAIVRQFCREGASVAVLDVNASAGTTLAEEMQALGRRVLFLPVDVGVEDQVRTAIEAAARVFGRIDVAVNSVGGAHLDDGPVTDANLAVFGKVMTLDLLGTIHVCRHAIPAMRSAGGGAIVNMSSGAALRGSPAHLYASAKGAILSLTRALAGSYAKDGIRANAICSGRVLTERVRRKEEAARAAGGSNARLALDDVVASYPFWLGTPEDIANIATFLACDESRMITGASIPADGGRSAY